MFFRNVHSITVNIFYNLFKKSRTIGIYTNKIDKSLLMYVKNLYLFKLIFFHHKYRRLYYLAI